MPVYTGQLGKQNSTNQAPLTPHYGGNLAYHRRQPVRPQEDATICNERYGVCIRKTSYRPEQEDRVSEISYFVREGQFDQAFFRYAKC